SREDASRRADREVRDHRECEREPHRSGSMSEEERKDGYERTDGGREAGDPTLAERCRVRFADLELLTHLLLERAFGRLHDLRRAPPIPVRASGRRLWPGPRNCPCTA